MIRPPPISTLFPYTTLSRSREPRRLGQTEHDVHVLNRLPRRAFHQVVDRGDHREAWPTDVRHGCDADGHAIAIHDRSEEHTSELQSRLHLVCRLLLEKKKKK